jgi:hypothetical protein
MYCEGDVTCTYYLTKTRQCDGITEQAFFHWPHPVGPFIAGTTMSLPAVASLLTGDARPGSCAAPNLLSAFGPGAIKIYVGGYRACLPGRSFS